MSTTLRLTHKTIGVEVRRRPYEVMVDMSPVTTIEMNQTINMPLEPGHHSLQVKCGRDSSRILTFDVADGELASFRCGGKRILLLFLLSFIVPSLALVLTRE